MKRIKRYSFISLIFFGIIIAILLILQLGFQVNMAWSFIISCVFIVFYLIMFSAITKIVDNARVEQKQKVVENISPAALSTPSNYTAAVLSECNIGILKYNDSYKITSVSEYFLSNRIDCVGEKLLGLFPELEDIVNGVSDKKKLIFNDVKFEVSKIQDSNLLIFKDITREYDLERVTIEEGYVLGFANFDNYDEVNASEDEIAYVNSNIKVPLIDYFKKYGVVYRTIRSNRLQLILNHKILESLLKDRFSILDKIKDESKKAALDITLSMSFAFGTNDLSFLDKDAIELLETAQSRGGDQVIVREKDKDPLYFGGSSEAKEQKSRVKVRVMVHTIKKLIQSSKNVIIIGHKDSDCDCVGAMLGMSAISKTYNKETYVVLDNVTLEKVTSEVVDKYKREINRDANVISEEDALGLCSSNSLIILCDHHSIEQSNCASLIKEGNKVLVIDHHRRRADLEYNAVLLYLESSASSTCELVSEFFEFDNKVVVDEYLANLMYLGIIIDTNHFKARVNARTFDAARRLKELGADSSLCEELAQEPFDLIKTKTEIVNSGEIYEKGIIIAAIEEGEYSRTLASQACDSLVETKGTKAAFVICKQNKDDVILSARSNGEINVQLILEGMNGGGHLTSAGLQRHNETVKDIKQELIENIEKYFRENRG